MFSVIIAAAGSSTRMRGVDKQLAELDGLPVFVISALKFDKSDKTGEIILSVPKGKEEEYSALARKHGVSKLKCAVAGGSSRFESVMNAVRAVSPQFEYIAVHDGARPLIRRDDIERVFDDAERYGAAVAAAPVTDTLKSVDGNGFITGTVPREGSYRAQTPQAFRRALYLSCVEQSGEQALSVTDDSRLFELCGMPVKITEVTALNLKITTQDDLELARAVYRKDEMV